MAAVRTVTNVAAGDDGTETWADAVYTDIGNLFGDKTLYSASDGATITFNLNNGLIQTVTLGGNRTLALSNVTTGRPFVLLLKQDGTGGRTVTWFSGISWAGGFTPILTTTINKTDVFGFIPTGVGAYLGFPLGYNL